MTPRYPATPGNGAGATGWRCLALALGLAAPLQAQSVLCLKRDGKLEVVQRAERETALVMEDGKWERFKQGEFALQPVPEYLPVLVKVEKQYFHKGARAVSDEGVANERLVQSGRYVFTADLEAPRALEDVVLALTLVGGTGGEQLSIWGIGHLDAHQATRVSIDVVTPFKLRGVRLGGVHVFVGGREALNSDIRAPKRAGLLDHMVASRVAGVQDAGAKPLMISDPVYPADVKPAAKGHAEIVCRVDVHGEVHDPAVKSATAPAFGAAALEAVKEWRFVPAVKGGVAVESLVEVPFDFDPPA